MGHRAWGFLEGKRKRIITNDGRCSTWGATPVGGFPDLRGVA